jgi:hypothetical protein
VRSAGADDSFRLDGSFWLATASATHEAQARHVSVEQTGAYDRLAVKAAHKMGTRRMSGYLTERVQVEGADAIGAFNARHGEMEGVLWCLSKHCREPLVAARSAPVVESLIWTLKSWWGVQGVRAESRAMIADVLTGLG